MRKLVSIVAAAVLLSATSAFAEESGGFVGFGIGGGGTQLTIKSGETTKSSMSGLNYGFVGGYKQFFTPHLGLRYYVNVDLHHNMSKDKKNILGDYSKPEIAIINYGVNVDFLGNFISNETLDFGGFIGLGLGANTLTGKAIEDNVKVWKEQNFKYNTTAFDIWLNVGLRTNIATNHGLEVVARVPFLPITLIKVGDTKGTLGQTYSVLARYTFSF